MGAQTSEAERLRQAVTKLLQDVADSGTRTRQTIEKLYSFLDILDRKATTLCSINSLLMTVNGLLIFRSLPYDDIGANSKAEAALFWKSLLLPLGALAILVSLGTLIYALRVNSMKWPFLSNFNTEPGSGELNPEIQGLCEVISLRTKHTVRQRWLTYIALGVTGIALSLICLYSYFPQSSVQLATFVSQHI